MDTGPAETQYNRSHTVVAVMVGMVVYCVAVLWFVATSPDTGIRVLLPGDVSDGDAPGVRMEASIYEQDRDIHAGDRLTHINAKPVYSFLDVAIRQSELRRQRVGPGGGLDAGADPSELRGVPGLVEIEDPDSRGGAIRKVELVIHTPETLAGGFKPHEIYADVRHVRLSEFGLTLAWFLIHLIVLVAAVPSYLRNPRNRMSESFCLMTAVAMAAFVPGFHWAVLAADPVLNIPFILAACLLPAFVLNFFTYFPREPGWMPRFRGVVQSTSFTAATLIGLVISLVYWSAYCMNGRVSATDHLNLMQRIVVALAGWDNPQEAVESLRILTSHQLVALRNLSYVGIGLAIVQVSLAVALLLTGVFRARTALERMQSVPILVVTCLAAFPIGYTVYLALFRRTDFALGGAQPFMFAASLLFTSAYVWGMFRQRLILADEFLHRGRRYSLLSFTVTGGLALLTAAGGLLAHQSSMAMNSTAAQEGALFLILTIATVLIFWSRDRLQSLIDRRFFSEKYQLDRTLRELNRAAGAVSDPAGLAEMTLHTCDEVLDVADSVMYVRSGPRRLNLVGARGESSSPATLSDGIFGRGNEGTVIQRIAAVNIADMSPVQKLMHRLRAELMILLRDEEGLHGIVILGRRRSGKPFTAEDIAFANAVTQMCCLALHSTRANQNLSRLNGELQVKMEHIADQQRQLEALRAELSSLHAAGSTPRPGREEQPFDVGEIRGTGPQMTSILASVRKISASDATVLVRGESGTGKEMMAEVIHRNSPRRKGPLIRVNCAALTPSLLTSELFGHVKGAFTGADQAKAGRFQAAEGGTLFLDEIGDISPETQVRLLRVLQERVVEPVGSDASVPVDVRVITATNRNLEAMIANGSFREDLFYRLNVVSVTLPPLRDRREDIPDLIFCFLGRALERSGGESREFSPEALRVLREYAWPGNIRELQNVVERAVVLSDAAVIGLDDLPPELTGPVSHRLIKSSTSSGPAQSGPDQRVRHSYRPPVPDSEESSDEVRVEWYGGHPNSRIPGDRSNGSLKRERPAAGSEQERDSAAVSTSAADVPDGLSAEEQVAWALEECGGNKAAAARLLGLPRSTFYSRLRKLQNG